MTQRPARMRPSLRAAGVGALLVLSSLVVPFAAPAAAETLAITPLALGPWTNDSYRYTDDACTAFADPDTDTTPDQTFASGPATPPSGTGSLKFVIDEAGEQQLFRTAHYNETPLTDIEGLQYSTFVETAGKQPPFFRLTLDNDGDGAYSEADGDESLFYFPVENGLITTGSWQTWDLDAGEWSIGGDATMPTTLAAYAAAHDGTAIVDSYVPPTPSSDPNQFGGMTVAQGCGGANTQGSTTYVDLIVVDLADEGVVKYDLEATKPARTVTIDPTSGPAGTKITVTGTDCYEPEATVKLGESSGQSGDELASAAATPAANGTYTATLTVPESANPDLTQTVFGICGPTAEPAFFTPGVPFDVTGASKPTGANGYRMVAADGGIFTFGAREFHGSTGNLVLNKPIVGGATNQKTYNGYWIVASDGGVFTFNAPFFGSLGDKVLTSPATEIEPTPTGQGYWIVTADGKVYTFGDANHFGDMAGKALNKPIIGMSVTPSGKGYWLVGEDGGIFNFGDAGFFGSTGDKKLNAPVIDLAPSVDNNGYYLLAKDGGVFTFGTADFKGSTGDMRLNAPVVAMLVLPSGNGYWLAASDGGVFTFGAGAEFLGSMGGTKLNSPVLDLIN
jgi:hypothetical protein